MLTASVVVSLFAALSGALAIAIMGWRDSHAENKRLREELRRRDVAERAARSLERLTPTATRETEIRTKVA